MDYSRSYTDRESFDDDHALENDNQDKVDQFSPGSSYHCKSALRDHASSMMLPEYRNSFNRAKNLGDYNTADDQYLKHMVRIWRCFDSNDLNLDGNYDKARHIVDVCPSSQFRSYMSPVVSDINGRYKMHLMSYLPDIMYAESKAVDMNISSDELQRCLSRAEQIVIRYTPLLIYFSLCVNSLNMVKNEKMPHYKMTIPGVVELGSDNQLRVFFNSRLNIICFGSCIVITTGNMQHIISRDMFLTISDKVHERFNIMLGSSIRDVINSDIYKTNHAQYHLAKCVDSVLNWGDDMLLSLGNNAFELIGKYEAYVVAHIILNDDKRSWNSSEFRDNLLEEDKKSSVDLHQRAILLCKILEQFPEHILAELHGLWRIWGHPIIDLVGGLKKMEDTSLKKHIIDEEESKIGERTFKLIFFRNYKSKHGHYPNCNMTDVGLFIAAETEDEESLIEKIETKLKESYLLRCLYHNQPVIDIDSRYKHSDWDEVEIYQNFEIPTSINLASMVKDKAVSMDRDELIDSIIQRHSVFDREKRRGVLKWLKKQTVRVKDFLEDIDAHGIDENSRIIGLYPKEREIKIKARFFSLMSYNLRMYVTITEELLGKYILPYFPMVTMSDTLLSMMTRLYNMTSPMTKSDKGITYCMNIDFSKWNQNMRYETNKYIFKNLDNILGFNDLINRTHKIFESCYLYLCSGEYVPVIVNDSLTTNRPFSRIGDESGKEGLRQKGWTITTVCDIISVAFRHRVKIELIGGGDNQVLTVTIVPNARERLMSEGDMLGNIRNKMEKFRSDLAEKMQKRGLPLKLEETWISNRLLMYNKIMYLNGVQLASVLKIVSRCFMYSNEGLMTLGNITSTLGTNFQSISNKDYSPKFAWVFSRLSLALNLNIFYLSNPITGHTRIGDFLLSAKSRIRQGQDFYGHPLEHSLDTSKSPHTLSILELVLSCLYFQKVLGGPGIGTPYQFIIKGFPDPLSEALTFGYYVLRNSPRTLKTPLECMLTVQTSKRVKWEHLVEDPVSINHDAPMHGLSKLRISSEEALRNANIENLAFRNLLDIGDNKYLQELSAALCTPDVIEPRLLHDIVSATIPGYVNSVTAKVDQSSTIQKLSSDRDIMRDIYLSEISYWLYLADKTKIKRGMQLGDCPTRDASALRNWTWGRKIVGVTVPHPAGFLRRERHYGSDLLCDQNYIRTQVKTRGNIYNERGYFRPYFGSYTQEKFKQHALASAYGDEDVLKRAIRIQKLLLWRYQEGSPMYHFIQSIVKCVTDADPSKFLPVRDTITGDVEHRYNDQSTKHGGIPCNLVQLYTHVSCNTSTFINHSKGSANENLHFQACIIWCCYLSLVSGDNGSNSTNIYHFHESCRTCVSVLDRPSDKETEPTVPLTLFSNPQNPLIYVKEEDIPIHYHTKMKLKREGEILQGTQVVHDIKDIHPTFSGMLVSAIMMKTITRSSSILAIDKVDCKTLITSIYLHYAHSVMSRNFGTTDYQFTHTELEVLEYMESNNEVLNFIFEQRRIKDYMRKFSIFWSTSDFMEDGIHCRMLSKLFEEGSSILSMKSVVPHVSAPYQMLTTSFWLIANNISVLECRACYEHWYLSVFKCIRDPLVCTRHGQLKHPKFYQMYSVDKLMKDVVVVPGWEFSIPKGPMYKGDHVSCLSYPLNIPTLVSTEIRITDIPSPAIYKSYIDHIRYVYSILCALNKLSSVGTSRIMIECPKDDSEIVSLTSAINMLNTHKWSSAVLADRVDIIIFILNYDELEESGLTRVKEISDYCTPGKFKVEYRSDEHLDISRIIRMSHMCIGSKECFGIEIPLILCEELSRFHTVLAELVLEGSFRKSELILPKYNYTQDPLCILYMGNECSEPISMDGLYSAIANHTFFNPRDDEFPSEIIRNVWKDDIFGIYLSHFIHGAVMIRDQQTLNIMRIKFCRQVINQMIISRKEGPNNWKFLLSVKALLAFLTETSTNKQDIMKKLNTVSGVNFVRGNVDKLCIVYTTSRFQKTCKFGRDIISMVKSVALTLHIEYRQSWKMGTYINLS
ncbi:TPA_asm: L [Asclepias syriaca virus 2]|uniref:RNA-directed RNA polymerase n=1 Tax=Asclepias syriaca virus 2 TaxID=2793723 RepID=A0A8D9PGR9_9RHAB|nr:L [Asclepias syriaca virus 2] [Asclepias syriaca virus 2]DAF42296.1 TPA_asm: L [Asclepias syriaca virus 2]